MGKIVGLTFDPKFVCPECGKEYASEAALNKHIKEKHTSAPPTASTNPDNGGGDT